MYREVRAGTLKHPSTISASLLDTTPSHQNAPAPLEVGGYWETTQILSRIPPLSYPENWLIIAAVLDLLHINAQEIISQATHLAIPDYRLEKVATINEVSYYNDSKSTIMQATLAAVDALKKVHGTNITVLLGGTSKGVDRTPFVQKLKDTITHIICFGGEAQQLYTMCESAGIPATATATLENSVEHARQKATSGAAVVLSPGEASFDLFKDYKERGERFKKIVLALSE
jgi:UDP-N-acetylmuramoylalanine--D-glutamate ligase